MMTNTSCVVLVRNYLGWISNNYPKADEIFVAELLRHCLCKVLKLESTGSSSLIESYSKYYEDILKKDISSLDLENKDTEYRQGFLEACVHCIEFARGYARVKERV